MADLQKKFRSAEAARFLGIGNSTLSRLRSKGGGPRFAKVGRSVIYDADDLEAWLRGRVCHSTQEYESLAQRTGSR